jgi:hypothetical protein
MNPILKKNTEELLAETLAAYQREQKPQRCFTGFDYQAETWPEPRWVVVKCEANVKGTNRRAIVTNRPGARVVPAGAYDEYADRGESENRNKELKCELSADRLSDHRYMANCFRMFMHCLAANMLVLLRRKIALPQQELVSPQGVPSEAWTGKQRRKTFNDRREADPLGEGHAGTWRMRLIKVAARIRVTARRVRVFLTSSWPFLNHFHQVGLALGGSG